MYYKVTIKTVCMVEAKDIVEAQEKAKDDDFIQAESCVTSIKRTTKSKAYNLYDDLLSEDGDSQ